MATPRVIDIIAGGLFNGGLHVDLFGDGSPLSNWVRAHLAGPSAQEPMRYVLCFLEDPGSFVLPEKDREQVLEQLSYLGLVDERSGAALKTRKQMKAERAELIMQREDSEKRCANHLYMLGRMTYLARALNTVATFNHDQFVASISGSDSDFARNFGWLRSAFGKTEEEQTANARICREALRDHPESYTTPLHNMQ